MQTRRSRAIDAMGLGPLWASRDVEAVPTESTVAPSADSAHSASNMTNIPFTSRVEAIAAMSWERLIETVAPCEACRLCETRTQTVFGVGVLRPDWMVIGEAPGADEDARGEPFVGQAGRLLDAMLASVGLSRERNVFIANVLKCRPPGNRNPAPEEISQCEPFLRRQIELLCPRLILLVGKFASATLLGSDASIASLRGKEHRLAIAGRDIPAVVTYHPAYLLRSPQEKAKAWADLTFAKRIDQRLAAL